MIEWWVYYDFIDYKYIDYDYLDCDYSEYALYWYINGIPVNAGKLHLNPTCFSILVGNDNEENDLPAEVQYVLLQQSSYVLSSLLGLVMDQWINRLSPYLICSS